MEIGYLNEVKAILKSLVLSSPDKITVDRLNRDYRDIEGEFIPFRRLGFNNLEQFLLSIPDTLLIVGSGQSATVYFVSNDKSKHIHQMIMQQKKPKGKPRANSISQSKCISRNQMRTPTIQACGRNNSNFHFANPPRKSQGQQFSPFEITNRNLSTRTVTVRDMPPHRFPVNANKGQQRNPPTNITRSLLCAVPQPNRIDVNFLPNYNQQSVEPKKPIESKIKQSYPQKETKSLNQDETMNKNKYQEQIKQLEILLSPTCHVGASASPVNKSDSLSPEIKKDVSQDNPCGGKPIESSLDIQPYKPNVNESKRKGINPTNDGKDQKEDEEELSLLANKFKKLLDISDAKVVDMDEAVPEFAANNQVFRVDFPKHTVSYGRKIPSYKVPDSVDVGTCVGLFISEIHNPFKFWFHIHKDEHELDVLMNQMERFYTSLTPNELRIPTMCLNPGQICAASYNDMWHRAEIVAPPVDNRIKVSFMDYGTVSEVKISEIKYLASSFAQLPAQALRGCLSHIKPRGLHWSHEATMHFLSLVSEIMLFGKITEIDKENLVFYMVLCDTHGKEVIQINKELVDKGYALYNEDWQEKKIAKNNGRRIHHPREDYPTFSMIEYGEYPSFSELVELDERGIDYEMIHDRIIFNKCAILNFHDNVPEPIRQLPFFLQTSNPFRTDILLELTGIKAFI